RAQDVQGSRTAGSARHQQHADAFAFALGGHALQDGQIGGGGGRVGEGVGGGPAARARGGGGGGGGGAGWARGAGVTGVFEDPFAQRGAELIGAIVSVRDGHFRNPEGTRNGL